MLHKVTIYNEFLDSSSPVSKLCIELAEFLNSEPETLARVSYVSKNYKPGGKSLRRIIQAFFAHLKMPFGIISNRILSSNKNTKHLAIVTTNPPLIQWSVGIACWLTKTPCILWFMDAHPELEIIALKRKNIPLVPQILEIVDKAVLNKFTGIVTLDESMKKLIQEKYDQASVVVAPPWATYLRPAQKLKVFDKNIEELNLIYAGNFGHAHDMAPLIKKLHEIEGKYNKKINLSFVGMPESTISEIKKEFERLDVRVFWRGRFDSLKGLSEYISNFDLGIVSLRADQAGLACPSKAFSYLSLGLPILYSGPREALSDTLIQSGWGFDVDGFASFLLHGHINEKLKGRNRDILPDVKESSLSVFKNQVGFALSLDAT